MQKLKPTSKLPNMPQKQKSYPLIGEPEMADELNKYEASLPKGYRGSAVVNPAAKGRDMPLPSSDGLWSKIKTFIK